MRRPVRFLVAPVLALSIALGVVVMLGAGPASAEVWKVPAPDVSLSPLEKLQEYETRVVFRINKARKAADLKPVRLFESCLEGFAERWARHLAATGDFEHRDQLAVLNKCRLSWVGETLARGTGLPPGRAVEMWLESPEHRAIILKPRATRAGVGVRIDSAGRAVAVLNFADRD